MRKPIVAFVFGWFCCIAPGGVAAATPGADALATDDIALQRMERAAVSYLDIAAHGPWPAFPDGPTLRPGERDVRVIALREILRRTGDLTQPDGGLPDVYTPELADAARAFQHRHGLNPDAAIGRATRAALTVPPAERAHMLLLNLQRLRALRQRLAPDAIVVNIPAFTLTAFANGEPAWHTRVVVGRKSWRTPTFDSAISRIELNPYWNVPSSIVRRELAPLIAADPDYLARHNMKVMAGNRLRQDPGPQNSLGQVKFHIPNDDDVYLHDTPGKQSFALDMRALSHGCVRVENAMELADRLLAAEPGWSADRLADEIATGRNIQIPLAQPIPVAIVYVTAWVDASGTVQFRPDLYRNDPREDMIPAAKPDARGAPLG